jgi:hypothetical protein
MRLTNLDYVQNILSAMSSDEVNSISDTTESLQVAEIVKTTFFNIMTRSDLPNQKKPFQLDPSLNYLEPVLMYIPEGIKSLEWVKYYDATDTMYKYVNIVPMQQFADQVNTFSPDESNVETLLFTVDGETFNFNYKNDITPNYCTVISNYYVIFDSYDNTLDSTLQASKTMAYGLAAPVWRMEDSFIPDLNEAQVNLLLNEAKSLAFLELKQVAHPKAEQEAKRQWSALQKDKSIDNKPSYFDQLPNYGRNTRMSRGPLFKW